MTTVQHLHDLPDTTKTATKPAGMPPFARAFHLLCPGPVNVADSVADALAYAEFGHREPEFEALLRATEDALLQIAGLDPSRHAAVLLTGSGTAANEAVFASHRPLSGTTLVLTNGEFGERLATLARYHHARVETLSAPWGAPLDLGALSARLARGDVTFVAMVHHETSTGMLLPVEEVGALCRAHGIALFVDAVSSFSADPLDIASWGVTWASTSAGKALAAYPGVSVVFGSHESFTSLARFEASSHYLNLARHYEAARTCSQTPHTPAVPLVSALWAAARLVLEEGVEERMNALRRRQRILEQAAWTLGIRTLLPPTAPRSRVLTTFLLPKGVSFDWLRDALRARGFVVYGGKGPLAGRVFQVSTINVSEEVLQAFVLALRELFRSGTHIDPVPLRAAGARGA